MSETGSVIRYVENGDVLAETFAYDMPHQSDWVYIECEAYKVYDVVHTVFPDEGMVSTVFIWRPDPEATDSELDVLYEQAIEARAGEREVEKPAFGDDGNNVTFIHDSTDYARVKLSAPPSNQNNQYEGINIPGTTENFTISSVTNTIEEGKPEIGVFLFEVDDPEAGAKMSNVRRTLHGQRESARTEVLENEGPEAYEDLVERIKNQG